MDRNDFQIGTSLNAVRVGDNMMISVCQDSAVSSIDVPMAKLHKFIDHLDRELVDYEAEPMKRAAALCGRPSDSTTVEELLAKKRP